MYSDLCIRKKSAMDKQTKTKQQIDQNKLDKPQS